MSVIRFKATPYKIGSWTVLRLPDGASAGLPSRGMVMVEGNINGVRFQTELEPDGKGSHWFKVAKKLQNDAHIAVGSAANLEIEPSVVWPRPDVPEDLQKALTKVREADELWHKITPNAQWEWIRWIRATRNPQTRQKRIKVACSKLSSGMRRPCCFNRNVCTEPYVSHNWILLDPEGATALPTTV